MNKVIVTGATGFIGRNLVRKLADLGFNICAIVRPNSANRDKLDVAKNIEVIELDMSDIDRLPTLIVGKCDIFCHLAWEGVRGEDRDNHELQVNNYLNSLKTIKAAHDLGCQLYMTTGSQAEYGVCNREIHEAIQCKPNTEYGLQKYQFFQDGMNLAKKLGISFKEARIFSLYGPGDNENTLVCSVLNKMLDNKEIDLTVGTHDWNFLYIDDAVDGMVKLITGKCPEGAYNLSGDETKILRDFVESMYRETKSKSILNFGAVPYPESGPVGIKPNNSRLKRETGWMPKIDFVTGINKMIAKLIEKR
ncbi:MAG: NAD(P)-dependent oxidoreductase [Candidatus Saccharibacteria bacterium]